MFGALHQRRDPDPGGGDRSTAPATRGRRHRRRLQAAVAAARHDGRASTLFAVALLCSGQNATLTGTLAGQIVMEGFLNLRLRPWLRRLITRLIAIIPAVIVIVIYGERGTGPLLILSQVILSLLLPFPVFPLVIFTSARRRGGPSPRPGGAGGGRLGRIAVLNVWLPVSDVRGYGVMYRWILVAVENSPADRTILDARGAAGAAHRGRAAAGPRGRRLGRAQLR